MTKAEEEHERYKTVRPRRARAAGRWNSRLQADSIEAAVAVTVHDDAAGVIAQRPGEGVQLRALEARKQERLPIVLPSLIQ